MSAPDFGTDVACLYDANAAFSTVSGIANLGCAIGRRFITPRGTLRRDPDYGTDLRVYLNADVNSATTAASVRSDAIAEALKDERVLSCSAAVTFAVKTKTMTITIGGDTAAGPFRFVLAISDLTAELLSAEGSV